MSGRRALFVTTVPVTLDVFLSPLARHFREQGWQIDALAAGASAEDSLAGAYDNRFDIGWSRSPLDPGNFVGTARRVREIVADGRYDIVHVHTPIASFVTRYALRRPGRSMRPVVIYTAHGFHFYAGQSALPHAVYLRIERSAARWTDYLVTINDEDFSAARAFGTIPAERVRLIPGIGVDVAKFRDAATSKAGVQIRRELEIDGGAFVLAMIAEFAPVKRHEMLLSAFAQVKDPKAMLLLVGDGPDEGRLRERAMALGLSSRIRWAGYRRDIPEVLAASDALALVSEREGLARSVLEAMAAGKPVIGTNTRGIVDAVDREAGWIVPKNDVAALASAIEQAASHSDERRRRGNAGRARAEEQFSLARIINEYEELYREALS